MSIVDRNLHYVDPQIRKTLISKIVFYWGACLVFSTLPLIIGTTVAKPDQLFVVHIGDLARRYWALYLILMGILPYAIRDALRIANRMFGPLGRLRSELAKFKATGSYQPVQSRKDDILHDLIEEINSVIASQKRDVENELAASNA